MSEDIREPLHPSQSIASTAEQHVVGTTTFGGFLNQLSNNDELNTSAHRWSVGRYRTLNTQPSTNTTENEHDGEYS